MDIPDALNPNLPTQAAPMPEAEQAPAQAPQQPVGPAYQMMQIETKQPISVPHDDVYTAVKSGQYLPRKSDEFVIKDSNDEARVVQGEYLKQALDQGFRLETSQEMHDRVLQEKYGGASGMAQAFVAGLARGGTLGFSDLAGAASPVVRERLNNLQEADPKISVIGELAGFGLGSFLGSTEESAIAKGAGAVISGAEKLGAGAAKVVERSIIKDGAAVGLPKKVAASIASKMSQEATVGSLVGAGNLVSEVALGKADVNAENLAASVGMGAIIGGAFGATLGSVEAATPMFKAGAKSVGDYVSGFTSREKAASEVLGYTPTKAAKLAEKNAQMAKDLPDWLVQEVGIKPGDDAAALVQKIENLKNNSGRGLGESIKEYDRIAAENPELQIKRKDVYQDLATKLDDRFIQAAENSPEGRAKLKQAGSYYEELVKSAQEGGNITLEQLQKARRNAYELGYSSTGMPIDTLEGQMARFAGRYYSDALKKAAENISQKLEDKTLFPQFILDHKNFSYASEVLPKVKSKALKGESINPIVASVLGAGAGSLVSEEHGKGAGLGAMAMLGARSFLRSDLRRNLVVLGQIEKANQKISQMTDKAIKGLAGSNAGKAAIKTAPFSIINSEFAKRFDGEKYKKPKSVTEAFQNMNDNFTRYSQNPEAYLQRVNRTTASMYNSAPQTTTALDSLSVSAAMFLGSKLPKRDSASGMLDILKKPRPPSQYDLAKFERYVGAVEHPERIFHEMEQGRVSHEAVEALQAVYPNLYTQLRDKALEYVGKNPNLPYSRKLQIGLLLDTPTDESLMPENVLGLQALFGTPEQAQSEGAVKPTAGAISKMNASSRVATDTEALEPDV